MRINYAIVFVSDMARSVAFYRDVLGLPLKFESPHWTEFATEGSTLALHPADGPNTDTGDPTLTPAGRCRTGFCVPDLDEFHQRLIQQNVPCVQEPQDVFGAKIAEYVDPDGMTISVSEESRAAGG